jgi:alginate O-acetyltransferase complex protein AlgI
MLFNSFVFVGLVLITFALYYQPRLIQYQVRILILSSLVFYAYNMPVLLLLFLFSASVNILTSYYVVYGKYERRKMIATLGVISNLTILAFFKYSSLFVVTFGFAENSIGALLLAIPLPIGISFYSFEGISLLVDVFREKHFNNKKVIPPSLVEHGQRVLFFISFFPHLVAGPILKAHDFLPQITAKYFRHIDWESCFKKIILGYFLKMVVADNLKDFTYWIAYPYFKAHTAITLLMMLLGYSCQIFADFAGYSLIAIGIAKLFGYQFLDNFNFPYISTSFKEFWKRWHISLSSFLMEYLYFPLGGNKKGKFRTYINLMITMILGGLWHGAAWSYAIWGAFHGIALAVERFLTDNVTIKSNFIGNNFKRLMVFCFVTIAWLLFKLPNFSHVIKFIQTMNANFSSDFDLTLCIRILIYSSPVFLYHFIYLVKTSIVPSFKRYEPVFYGSMLFLILTNSGSVGTFIYFQF